MRSRGFDGSTEKSYDYYCGKKGSYRKAVRGIKTPVEIFDKNPHDAAYHPG